MTSSFVPIDSGHGVLPSQSSPSAGFAHLHQSSRTLKGLTIRELIVELAKLEETWTGPGLHDHDLHQTRRATQREKSIISELRGRRVAS